MVNVQFVTVIVPTVAAIVSVAEAPFIVMPVPRLCVPVLLNVTFPLAVIVVLALVHVPAVVMSV
jgi:hypothetical protein